MADCVIKIDLDKLKATIERCLRRVPKTEWHYLPQVLLEKGYTRFFALVTTGYLVLDFADDEESKRLAALKEGYDPFPGLVKPNDVQMSAAFQFENTKMFLQECTVKGQFAFSLGKDVALVIRDHLQQIKTPELGDYTYRIKLAYLISFGEKIRRSDLYAQLESLMIDSFRRWGISDV